ncbi:MAG: hypothetical protein RLO50_18965 [Azospirillaceae bacterium]
MRWLARRDGWIWATAAALASASVVAHADPVSVSVRNNSPTQVLAIQVSPDYSTTWGANRLSTNLGPGESTTIQLNEGACFYDIQVERSQGSVQQIWGVNVCARPQVDLR